MTSHLTKHSIAPHTWQENRSTEEKQAIQDLVEADSRMIFAKSLGTTTESVLKLDPRPLAFTAPQLYREFERAKGASLKQAMNSRYFNLKPGKEQHTSRHRAFKFLI